MVHRKPPASNRYIHCRSAQAWKEKATAIRTLKARAIEYCSDAELLANKLAYLLEVSDKMVIQKTQFGGCCTKKIKPKTKTRKTSI